MKEVNLIRRNIISLAKCALVHTNLLIEQCDSWLSEEEGRKNMEKQILERKKKNAVELSMHFE